MEALLTQISDTPAELQQLLRVKMSRPARGQAVQDVLHVASVISDQQRCNNRFLMVEHSHSRTLLAPARSLHSLRLALQRQSPWHLGLELTKGVCEAKFGSTDQVNPFGP